MKNADIAVLVEKVQKDKQNAFEELYNAIWKTVYYFCYKNLGNEQDAKDAMQTVFIKLYEKIDTLHHPNAFNKFLFTTMKYTCSEFHKATFRNDAEDVDNYEASLLENNAEFLPTEAFENQEIRQEVAKMVEALPEKQREAILLFYFEEKSIKEIAEITGSKFDAVNNRLVTARKTLKERAEALVKKGSLNCKMAAMSPVPILTKILLEEAGQVATLEVGNLGWQDISSSLDLTAHVGEAVASEIVAETIASQATAAVSTAAGIGINLAICATIAAAVVTGVFITYSVRDTFNYSPQTAYIYYQETPEIPEADEHSMDLESLIQAITNRAEFIEFTDMYGFTFLGGSRTSDRGSQMLYYLQQQGRLVYLGYTEDLQNNFRVVYEVADSSVPRITSGEVSTWFLR